MSVKPSAFMKMLTTVAINSPMRSMNKMRPIAERSRFVTKPKRLIAPKVPAVIRNVVAMDCSV